MSAKIKIIAAVSTGQPETDKEKQRLNPATTTWL